MRVAILPEENAKFCSECGACVALCEQKCIKKGKRGQPPAFDYKNCIGCGKCVNSCFGDKKLIKMINIVFNQVFYSENCNVCKKCVDVCKKQCIFVRKGQRQGENICWLVFDPENCNGCGLCVNVCPKKAVIIVEAPYTLSAMERLGMIG